MLLKEWLEDREPNLCFSEIRGKTVGLYNPSFDGITLDLNKILRYAKSDYSVFNEYFAAVLTHEYLHRILHKIGESQASHNLNLITRKFDAVLVKLSEIRRIDQMHTEALCS